MTVWIFDDVIVCLGRDEHYDGCDKKATLGEILLEEPMSVSGVGGHDLSATVLLRAQQSGVGFRVLVTFGPEAT